MADNLIRLVQQKHIKKVYFTGSGTSFHASTLISMYFNKFTGLDAQAVIPDNFTNYFVPSLYFKPDETLLIGISQSGTSSSTLDAIRKAKVLVLILLLFQKKLKVKSLKKQITLFT
ncbi:SIS domain-containing protein [Lactobacillus sp. R2/2]|nr:SIS domain-containing protein [Lactobacillus sp. R2/2]